MYGRVCAAKRLVLIVSTHVDDLKGAGEEKYRRFLLAGLEKEFSTLKVKLGSFECAGVMHEQTPKLTKFGRTSSTTFRRSRRSLWMPRP